jgi:hypothetical protein
MRKFRGLIVLGAIAVAGCNLSSDLSTTQRIGIINMTQMGSDEAPTVRIVGQFFQTSPTIQPSIPNTQVVGDTCTVYDYAGPPDEPNPIKVDNLNAGSSIAVATDKAEGSMVPSYNAAGSVVYSVPTGPLPFTPGELVNIEIPGDTGGFPAQSLKIATLKKPTFAPIERHPAEDLTLSWSPVGDSRGAIQLSFLFSSDSANTTPNKEMFCSLRDDGSYTIPHYLVAGAWASSSEAAQSVDGFRWNTSIQQNKDVLMDVIVQTVINPVTFTTDEAPATDIRVNTSH